MVRPSPRITALLPVVCVLVAASACVEPPPDAGPPNVDRAQFEALVYPLLLRDCGFPACHGTTDRFFQVHGPNRSRLDPETALDAPATGAEIQAAYERSRSMLASVRSPRESLLLRKPLEVDEGGAPHMGIDQFGRDVYVDREAFGYRTLLTWASGRGPEPAMEPEPEIDAGPEEDVGDGGGEYDAGVAP